MQTDGNLVLYSTDGKPRWASKTSGNAGAFLNIQNDGNLVVYRAGSKTETADNALWTACSNDPWNLGEPSNNSGNSEKAPINSPQGMSIDIVYNGNTNSFNVPFSLHPGQKTIFLIHGWNSGPNRAFGNQGAPGSLDTELLSLYPDSTIIRVDWTQKADTWSYPYAAGQVSYIAQALAQVFATLGITPNNTHVIGHSLGAHIAGFASYDYRKSTGKYIGEIVGLDPAAPFLEPYNNGFSSGLDSTQAQRVVVIHSSDSFAGLPAGGYGNFSEIGTLDIYMKSGSDIYGLTGPNDHDLAIKIYETLVTGQSYPGVNKLAVVEIETPFTPLPTPQLPPPTEKAAPDSDFTDVFNLSQLDNVDLKGKYTIDYGRPFTRHP
jgi:pimeloyl-ACP methyl ester carboxylesterase